MSFFDSFRVARWVRTLNLVLQAGLFLSLFAGLNYLARHQPSHSARFDLTEKRRYSLSPETLSYLRNLPQPVRIVVTLTEDSDEPALVQALRDIRGLLREYTYATEADPTRRITVDYLDIYQRRRDADQLGIDQANSIFLLCGDKRRIVPLNDIYKVEKGEKKGFQGEQAITAAILDVSKPGRKKIYFLSGHGELRPADVDPNHGLSALREALRQRNFEVEEINLAFARKIPADASLLVAVWPQGRFQALEQELLRQYLSASAGRFMLLTAPASPHGLEDLLLDWGILVDDDLICDIGRENMTEEGELLLRFFTEHPVTRTLIDYNLQPRFSASRSVRPDPGRSLGNGLNVTTLAATSTTAWGEVSYSLRIVPTFNPGVDIRALPGMEPRDRLGVIVASERVSVRDNLPFSVRGGRVLVFGNGDFISNQRIVDVANQNIFLSAVNWAVESDAQFNIPVRPIDRFQLSLSADELGRLRYTLLLALPAAAALLGLLVYWARRR